MVVVGRYSGKMSTGVGPGKSFVTQQSRCGGSVGGCVWLVVCVLMMSAWDDGDAGTFDLASDLIAAGGAAGGLTRKGDDAEEIGGAVFGFGAAVGHPGSAVDDSAGRACGIGDSEYWGPCDMPTRRCDAEEIGGPTRKGDDEEDIGGGVLVAAGGVAGGLTRKGDDAEEIGGAVFGFEADIDHTWSVVDDSAGRACSIGDSEYWGPCDMPTRRCDAEEIGGLLCDASGGAWGTWNWGKINLCDSLPEHRPRLFDAIIQQLTTARVAREKVLIGRRWSQVGRRQFDPGVGIGVRGSQWKVWKARRKEGAEEAAYLKPRMAEVKMAEKLAKMQIDAVITDVTSEESANPGCEEESVLVDSHSVVGIYFGRR
jgi:hypothetical protein